MTLFASLLNSPELGHFALSMGCASELALALCACAATLKTNPKVMLCARLLAWFSFALIAFSFVELMGAFAFDNFSLKIVYFNSAKTEPLFFKVTGAWGNHEGSTLLWVVLLSFFGALTALLKPSSQSASTLSTMGVLGFLFSLFCETSSNPFLRLDGFPTDGLGINPLLQDLGLALHPPILYMGYVGMSVAYAAACSALFKGELTLEWANFIRKATLAAWAFLTAGIALGSWWSYYVLGWGGYWFWDPVENASLIPWLSATASIHALCALRKNSALKIWVLFLSLISFAFAVSGTFLVRSGILNSVHAFAADPRRGIFILVLLFVVLGAGVALLAVRAKHFETQPTKFAFWSRENGLLVNNALLSILCIIVLFGTLYPALIQLVSQQSISVGKPFFDTVCTPFAFVLLAGTGLSFFLPWQGLKPSELLKSITAPLALSIASFILSYFFISELWISCSIALCIWILSAALTSYFQRNHSHLTVGATICHIGCAVSMLGIVGMSQSQSDIVQLPVEESALVAGKLWKLNSVETIKRPDYIAYRATISVSKNGKDICTLHPERRFFLRQRQANSFVAIHTNLIQDYYAVLAKPETVGNAKEWILRLHYNPLAPFIWIGACLMALGAFISIAFKKLFKLGSI